MAGLPAKEKAARRAFIKKAIGWQDKDACLIWPYARDPKGYARFGPRYLSRRICREVNGESPLYGPLALHSCGNGHNACVNPWHLYWGSFQDNADDSAKHGTHKKKGARGEQNLNSKLTIVDVKEIRELYASGCCTMKEVGRKHNICFQNVSLIVNYKSWASV